VNGFDSRVRAWLIWVLPFAVIAALIGWETDWGHALKRVPALDPNVAPQPVNVALLPEYRIEGGIEGRRDTVERTLFNPTRRPAPPQAVASAASAMQKGQFVLTGTTVVDQKATAFLREVNGGRSRRVQQGETINGMLVAEVQANRIKLTQAGDSEELTLKVAAGPRATVQPQAAASPQVPAAGVPGAPPPGPTVAAPQAAPTQEFADVLANRRRAARAAEAAQSAAAAAGTQPPAPAVGTPAQRPQPAQAPDPAWNDVYRRMMQPRQ
jgi:hypothetical protein